MTSPAPSTQSLVPRVDDVLDEGLDPPKNPEDPDQKKCPFCRSAIANHATRCPQCTSRLELAEA